MISVFANSNRTSVQASALDSFGFTQGCFASLIRVDWIQRRRSQLSASCPGTFNSAIGRHFDLILLWRVGLHFKPLFSGKALSYRGLRSWQTVACLCGSGSFKIVVMAGLLPSNVRSSVPSAIGRWALSPTHVCTSVNRLADSAGPKNDLSAGYVQNELPSGRRNRHNQGLPTEIQHSSH